MDELVQRLTVLRALAADEHVTHAAEAAGVPQPTVSRWLAALGTSLGAPVALRSGRRVRLTRAGRLLCEAADRALTALEAGQRAAAEEVSPERGQVALGFLHLLGRSVVPSLVSTFREDHPAVRFRLVQNSRQDILAHLADGDVDLALVSPPPTDPAFAHAVIREEELILVVPPGHRLAGRPAVRVAELAGEEFVGLEPGYGLRQITDDLCAAAGFTPTPAFEGQETETVRGLVAAGLGVALLPHADSPSGLPEIPLDPRAAREIALVWPADTPLPPAVQAFRDHALAP
ncbi:MULTISPECIES: LysR family transcriptional regulator [Saccharothrix]|uniref:DNA-binding transcriptional LysR family regulator n=1 Tax=Saccharothrix texasensis TaxID=103734 RepID=A0A3N1H7K7_9PSEU|nr:MULTISPECIES: LysR family transcriptional regulator [Saccharothrix]ROP38406.1 DNA-binding transcriptional LysR family regulator [Saccharothrix texasensis]